MVKKILPILMIIMIPCCLNNSRIGFERLKTYEDNRGTNWRYIYSNSTLIFDNLYISTSGFTIYFPFVLLEAYNIPNFTLILKNENTILVNDLGNLAAANAFEFIGDTGNQLNIQGDGKLIIKVYAGGEGVVESIGLEVLYTNLVIKENAKVEILMNDAQELKGLRIFNGRLYMKGNSQLSVYIGKDRGSSIGIECGGAYLSDNVTINSSLLNYDSTKSVPQWFYNSRVELNNYTNVTFITKGTMELPENFFSFLGKNPIIINAIETLEEFNKTHKLTQKDVNSPILFSNYFTEKESKTKTNDLLFIRMSFFILLNLILFI